MTLFFKTLIGLLILIMLVYCAVGQQNECISTPMTVNNINNCKDGFCEIDLKANVQVEIKNGKPTCLELTLVDGGKISTVQVYTTNSVASQSVEYCYYTDFVLASTVAMCGCDSKGFTKAFCNNCKAIPLYSKNVICGDAMTLDAYCPGKTSYCWNTGFSALKRHKVCKLKPKETVSATINLKADDRYISFPFSPTSAQKQTHYSADLQFSATTSSISFTNRQDVEFIVVDLLQGSSIFMANKSLVNGLHEYDSNKIGWYKVGANKEIDAESLSNSIRVDKIVCAHSNATALFNIFHQFKQVTDIMDSNPKQYHNIEEPDAYFSDQEWQAINDVKNNDYTPPNAGYAELKDGFFGYEYLNPTRLSLVGVGFKGNFIPAAYYQLTTDTILQTVSGKNLNAKWNLHCKHVWFRTGCGQVCVAEHRSFPGEYGYCFKRDCNINSEPVCRGFDIEALNWPSNQYVRYYVSSQQSLNIQYPECENSKSVLTYPIRSTSVQFNLNLKNITIKFSSPDVRPNIISCKGVKDGIQLQAKTDGADGNVIASVAEYPSQVFYLRTTEKSFLFQIPVNVTNNFTLSLTASQYSKSCTVEVNTFLSSGTKNDNSNNSNKPWETWLNTENAVLIVLQPFLFWMLISFGFVILVALFIIIISWLCCGEEKKSKKSKRE